VAASWPRPCQSPAWLLPVRQRRRGRTLDREGGIINKRSRLAGLLGPFAAVLLAVGCGGDSVSPRVPEFAESPTVGRITGLGQVGTGSQSPGNPVLGFDFDVRADLTGRLAAYD